MTTALNATTFFHSVWPLPATKLPNAHLTWSEYELWQAARIATEAEQPVPMLVAEAPDGSIRFLSPTPAATGSFVWPLPATLLPSAHLTWAEWTAEQAQSLGGQQPENVRTDRAA
ncbi:MAG: hypothetical protein ACRDHP_18785 [Ktedonobacterales bacterium]